MAIHHRLRKTHRFELIPPIMEAAARLASEGKAATNLAIGEIIGEPGLEVYQVTRRLKQRGEWSYNCKGFLSIDARILAFAKTAQAAGAEPNDRDFACGLGVSLCYLQTAIHRMRRAGNYPHAFPIIAPPTNITKAEAAALKAERSAKPKRERAPFVEELRWWCKRYVRAKTTS